MYDSVFAPEDVGKDVVDRDGNILGLVSSVSGGAVYVDPDPGVTNRIRATLGWGVSSESESSYPIEEAIVATVTDRRIRVSVEQ